MAASWPPAPSASRPKRVSRFMILGLLVMAAALTFIGLQMRGTGWQRAQAHPGTAPARTTSPHGTGNGSSPPANPNIDRNG